MNKKTTGIISYLTVVGWLAAFCLGDRENARFHLNQSLVLILCGMAVSVIAHFPFVGGFVLWAMRMVLFIFWLMGFVHACEDRECEVPLIGGIRIIR